MGFSSESHHLTLNVTSALDDSLHLTMDFGCCFILSENICDCDFHKDKVYCIIDKIHESHKRMLSKSQKHTQEITQGVKKSSRIAVRNAQRITPQVDIGDVAEMPTKPPPQVASVSSTSVGMKTRRRHVHFSMDIEVQNDVRPSMTMATTDPEISNAVDVAILDQEVNVCPEPSSVDTIRTVVQDKPSLSASQNSITTMASGDDNLKWAHSIQNYLLTGLESLETITPQLTSMIEDANHSHEHHSAAMELENTQIPERMALEAEDIHLLATSFPDLQQKALSEEEFDNFVNIQENIIWPVISHLLGNQPVGGVTSALLMGDNAMNILPWNLLDSGDVNLLSPVANGML